MHELTVVRQIISMAEESAVKNSAEKVEEIYLRIGVLNNIIESFLFKAFEFARRGTKCENAELCVSFFPAKLGCSNCGEQFNVQAEQLYTATCPKCGCKENKYISGREFYIDFIKVS